MFVAESEKSSSRKSEWKKGKTLQMPELIPLVLEEIREGLGRNNKQQWAVVTAAVLRLLDAPKEVQALYVSEALLADTGAEAIADLIERTRRGELRAAAQRRVEESERVSRLPPPRPKIAGPRPRVGGA
jgi:hypothetical protein